MKKQKQCEPEHQFRNFLDAARESGCDEDEAAFEAKFRQVAKHKPKPPDAARKDEKNEAPE